MPMYTERNYKEYPYDGEFYFIREGEDLLSEGEEEVVVLDVKCDIQEVSQTLSSGAITMSYNICFEVDSSTDIPLRAGHLFRGSMRSVPVTGVVDGIMPNCINGCIVHVKATNG